MKSRYINLLLTLTHSLPTDMVVKTIPHLCYSAAARCDVCNRSQAEYSTHIATVAENSYPTTDTMYI